MWMLNTNEGGGGDGGGGDNGTLPLLTVAFLSCVPVVNAKERVLGRCVGYARERGGLAWQLEWVLGRRVCRGLDAAVLRVCRVEAEWRVVVWRARGQRKAG